MRERAAYGKLFVALAQHDHGLAAPVAIDAGDRAQIHDRAAVDLPERLGIELLVELLDRLPDERLTVAA